MSFVAAGLLWGLVLVAGPVAVHLLNRRRYRTVEWGAMAFVEEAIRANRRHLMVRDVVLLALRSLVVLLLVLCVVEPYWVRGERRLDRNAPVHAIVVLDNSLSMDYRSLDASLLDRAKAKAKAYVEQLPPGSAASIITTANARASSPLTDPRDITETIDRVRVSDRGWAPGDIGRAIAGAYGAVPELPNRRVAILSDAQRSSWGPAATAFGLPDDADVQVVDMTAGQRPNVWVESFDLIDGFAGVGQPAVFTATARSAGGSAGRQVRATFWVDGVAVEERSLTLSPGQAAELEFRHTFTAGGPSADPVFVPCSLRLDPGGIGDRLDADDERVLIAPIVTGVPIVCIDELGPDESPPLSLYGETYPLRRLLASAGGAEPGGLFDVRHRRPADVAKADLADARMVVVAGLEAPDPALVELLSQYVRQGGRLVVMAGGEFDPLAWSADGYASGEGILPLPLEPDRVGELPVGASVEAFAIDPQSVADDALRLAAPVEDWSAIVRAAAVYRAVRVDESLAAEAVARYRDAEAGRRQWLKEADRREQRWAEAEERGELDEADRVARRADRDRRVELDPQWLAYRQPLADPLDAMPLDRLTERAKPRVIARYTNGAAFAVHQRRGHGEITFITTGLLPQSGWSGIAVSRTMLIVDRLARSAVTRSLPSRTLGPTPRVVVPVPAAQLGARFTLTVTGDAAPRPMPVEALGGGHHAVVIRDTSRRGFYRVDRYAGRLDGPAAGRRTPDGSLVLAINGPAGESDLGSVPPPDVRAALAPAVPAVLDADDALDVSGRIVVGVSLWRVLAIACGALLVVEMMFLAWPHRQGGATASLPGRRKPTAAAVRAGERGVAA